MAREFEISDTPGAVPPGLSFDDLFKYGEVIAHVLLTIKSAQTLAVGSKVDLDVVKFRARGGEYSWDMGELKRDK